MRTALKTGAATRPMPASTLGMGTVTAFLLSRQLCKGLAPSLAVPVTDALILMADEAECARAAVGCGNEFGEHPELA